MQKKILYIDLDGVMVNFQSGIDQLDDATREKYQDKLDEVPHIFGLMVPINNAVDAFHKLAEYYDVYFLSTAPWENSTAWSDKLEWVKRYLGQSAHKRLILSHHKNLNIGSYLIDDRKANGADKFAGEHIHFGTALYPNWTVVLDYLIPKDPIIQLPQN